MTDAPQTIEEQEEILEPDAPYNAADRRQVRAKEKAKKAGESDLKDVMEALLQMRNGRKWLAWVLNDLCGLHRTTVNAAYDTNATYFREGALSVGLELQRQALAINRTNYFKIFEENL